MELLKNAIVDGLEKEREALHQERYFADEMNIAKLRRTAAASVEAENAATKENAYLKDEIARVWPQCAV